MEKSDFTENFNQRELNEEQSRQISEAQQATIKSETNGGYSNFESEKEPQVDFSMVHQASKVAKTEKESKAEDIGYTSIDDNEELENEVEKQFQQSCRAASIRSSIKQNSHKELAPSNV